MKQGLGIELVIDRILDFENASESASLIQTMCCLCQAFAGHKLRSQPGEEKLLAHHSIFLSRDPPQVLRFPCIKLIIHVDTVHVEEVC